MKKILLLFIVCLSVIVAFGQPTEKKTGIWYSTWFTNQGNYDWLKNSTFKTNTFLLGDVNGDGKDDAVSCSEDTWYVGLSTGELFSSPQIWKSSFGGSLKVMLADINGDGKKDAVVVSNTYEWTVALSNGSGFGVPYILNTSLGNGTTEQFFADYDGDGDDDLFLYANGSWSISLNNNGFLSSASVKKTNFGGTSTSRLVGDINGDAKADLIIYFKSGGVWESALSTGSGFSTSSQWKSNVATDSDVKEVFVRDINGDGKDDAVYYQSTTGKWKYSPATSTAISPIIMDNHSGDVLLIGDAYGYTKDPGDSLCIAPRMKYVAIDTSENEEVWKVTDVLRWKIPKLQNRWQAVNYKDVPLYSINGTDTTYKQYDSSDPLIIDMHLRMFSESKIDYIIFDLSNSIDADGSIIRKGAQAVAKRIKLWNENPENTNKIYFSCALGGLNYQSTNALAAENFEMECGLITDYFLDEPGINSEDYFKVDGKPLIIMYTFYARRMAWENAQIDKSKSSVYTILQAQGNFTANAPLADQLNGKYFGWYASNNISRLPIGNKKNMVVLPGHKDQSSAYTNRVLGMDPEGYYKANWDSVLVNSPDMVTIVGFQNNENTNVEPALNQHLTNEDWTPYPNPSPWTSPWVFWNITRQKNLAYKGISEISQVKTSSNKTTNLTGINVLGASYWSSLTHSGPNYSEWIYIDQGASKLVQKVALNPRYLNGVPVGFPKNFVIQYSQDSTNWVQIPGQNYENYSIKQSTKGFENFIFSSPINCRFIRILATKLSLSEGSYSFQLDEIELNAPEPNRLFNLAPDGSISSFSSAESGRPAGNAIDGIDYDNANLWTGIGFPQFIEIDLGQDKLIQATSLFAYADRAYKYKIEAKADGETYSLVTDRSSNEQNGLLQDNFDRRKARFVKLTITGASGYTGNAVSIREFKILGQNLSIEPNLSVKGTISAFSSAESGRAASNAIDGVDSSDSNLWTGIGFPQFIEIDLGADKYVQASKLTSFSNRIYKYKIEARKSSGTYTTVIDKTNNTAALGNDFWFKEARFVKLTVTGAHNYTGNAISIREFSIYGKSVPPQLTSQIIQFPTLDSVELGQPDFTINASTNSGLPINFTSSNPNVAKVVNGKIKVISAGTTVITAYQEGNSSYSPATPVNRLLIVEGTNLLGALFDASSMNDQHILPIKITSFTAISSNNFIALNWQTLSESNTSHFIVYRSIDGLNFQEVTVLKAAANSAETLHYNTKDSSYPKGYPVVYYKLVTIDLDAKISYSKIISVNVNLEDFSSKIYPNPTKDKIILEHNSLKSEIINIQIIDLNGKVISFQDQAVVQGINRIVYDVSKLNNGTYLIKWGKNTKKFIKIN
ncbi:discoidin domain-containing protein [Pedobacter glucosidilyticus]|uniref:discoidin domain-containing protein n=1 Tax=Pedobacter glucosidilyticus TaxID=1122941 RepID=UPI0026EFDA19|nr:discoidin domain-containing protein [Pedobacter glucosidilyticus]